MSLAVAALVLGARLLWSVVIAAALLSLLTFVASRCCSCASDSKRCAAADEE